MKLLDQTFVVGPFQCNCRLLACPRTGEAALIDAGDEGPKLLRKLNEIALPGGVPLRVKYLLHTHGHLDHIGGTRDVKQGLSGSSVPQIALHAADEPLYKALKVQG